MDKFLKLPALILSSIKIEIICPILRGYCEIRIIYTKGLTFNS